MKETWLYNNYLLLGHNIAFQIFFLKNNNTVFLSLPFWILLLKTNSTLILRYQLSKNMFIMKCPLRMIDFTRKFKTVCIVEIQMSSYQLK